MRVLRWVGRLYRHLLEFLDKPRGMSLLTLAGVVIAVFTGLIFLKQLQEMRTDERAWILFSQGPLISFPKDENAVATMPVIEQVEVGNKGKTPARAVYNEWVMEYVINGDSPDFVYTNRMRTFESTGMLPPNEFHHADVKFETGTSGNSRDAAFRYLTVGEYRDLVGGKAYMVVYGRSNYIDIFGTKHWLNYCNFFLPPNVIAAANAKACTDYNDTDHN